MSRRIEEPVTQAAPRYAGDDGTVTTHPSFAQIGASRVSGRAVLYGSDFTHQHYVRIRIAASELHRNLANDWHHSSINSYVEVELSEAQWATFVSSMNVGGGVPCTLRSKDGEMIPELPDPASRTEQFGAEMAMRVDRAIGEVAALAEEVEGLKISEKAKKALLDRIRSARTQLVNNTKFIAEQFDEHMEGTIEKAKIEVNAYAVNTLMRAGLDAVQANALGYAPADAKLITQAPEDVA